MPERLDVTRLEAGRELDALVAEAMGVNVVARDWPCGYWPDGGGYDADTEAAHKNTAAWFSDRGPVFAVGQGWPPRLLPGLDRPMASVRPVPFYSTDIAAAWTIVRAFRTYRIMWNEYYKRHDVQFSNYKPFGMGSGLGKTPEVAICAAALDLIQQYPNVGRWLKRKQAA